MSKLALTLIAIFLMFPLAANAQQGFGTNGGFGGTTGSPTVLEGGVNGVADIQNPNDPDGDLDYSDDSIACPTRSMFKASATYGGGWWGSVTEGATGTCRWSAQNEVMINAWGIEPFHANWQTATWDVGACIPFASQGNSDIVNAVSCAATNANVSLSRPVFITEWRHTLTHFGASSSCDIRLTDDGGVSEWASSEVTINGPTQLSSLAVVVHPINTLATPPLRIGAQYRNGTTCDTPACICDSGVRFQSELWGIPQ